MPVSSYRPLYHSPLKRALVHMLRHGGLKRSNNNRNPGRVDEQRWTGKTHGGGFVTFKDSTIVAAGECGLIKVSVNRAQKDSQFASLTEKGFQYAKMVSAVVKAKQKLAQAEREAETIVRVLA